jgi:hypothetical protein
VTSDIQWAGIQILEFLVDDYSDGGSSVLESLPEVTALAFTA